ncbi:Chaperonin Cpn60/TCP-1 [Carpediemonas membranifera]|nr:Chaperonin Cpn60/TCP-1 [Carpediemonas membranifera]KAG9390553.1 Chaperonin Cpn60/TCP-1 [Carpediemonas membranifera]|eukprot:KAG9390552.1 Chaperonin Cpn60/TCP-1 [Carpediemonas membranifera]
MAPTSSAKSEDVRTTNIAAAEEVLSAIRTSLGPRGMDKMVITGKGDVLISNDGATIMKELEARHPAARLLIELSKAQDVEAGDGTTSVVVMCCSLLHECPNLLKMGLHPSVISRGYGKAAAKAEEILDSMSIDLDLDPSNVRKTLITAAKTSLSSKVVSQYSKWLAPIAVDAVSAICDPLNDDNVNLDDIRVVKLAGDTIDRTELIKGLCFPRKVSHVANGPTSISNAKIAFIQFCLSAPKTTMDSSVVVSDYQQMDRLIREERRYILTMCKKIKASGCNVVLIQKSILRDAVSEIALAFLAKMGIMVVRNIEREDASFVCRTVGCKPIASIEHFTADKLGHAFIAEEIELSGKRMVRVIRDDPALPQPEHSAKTITVLVRGVNKLILDEADRSLHDALCVIRSLVKKKKQLPGGGAAEIELAMRLDEYAQTLSGLESYVVKAYANAFELIPYTLAENAGLNPIATVTKLRSEHNKGVTMAGIHVKKGDILDMRAKKVIQPTLVTSSAVKLATETAQMILKISDIVAAR